MTFDEYQAKAQKTALLSGDFTTDLSHYVLGTVGEAGEVAEKLKKIIRDKNGAITNEDKETFKKEIGDVLWYLAGLSHHLGYSFDEVAQANIDKVLSRQRRGTLHGSGDDR